MKQLMRQEKVYPVSKECVVKSVKTGRLLAYDADQHRVYQDDSGAYHVFPSKARALSAIHHSIELDRLEGKHDPWLEYTVVET